MEIINDVKDIAIYGFGGLGRELACIINSINRDNPQWNIIGYFDDGKEIGTENRYGKVLGGMDELNSYPNEINVVMAIANPATLKRLIGKMSNSNVLFPNIVAPNCSFFDKNSISLGRGNLLGFGVRVSCDVRIGDFNLINGCCSFGHGVVLGNYNVMHPETRISGETCIGDANFFGVRSTVLQGLKIGNNTRIGVGSVIMRKTKDDNLYFGNPAKIVK